MDFREPVRRCGVSIGPNDPRSLPRLESIGKSPEELAAIKFEVKLPGQ
jgi:hypothetical protein